MPNCDITFCGAQSEDFILHRGPVPGPQVVAKIVRILCQNEMKSFNKLEVNYGNFLFFFFFFF